MTLRIGSLCSGAGGLDMAVEKVFGAKTVWHFEINEAASKVLEYRYPGVPNHRDLTATDWEAVEPVDILTGGYPCQPFSHAGQSHTASQDVALLLRLLLAARARERRHGPRHSQCRGG